MFARNTGGGSSNEAGSTAQVLKWKIIGAAYHPATII
jgi:hypothetical protein